MPVRVVALVGLEPRVDVGRQAGAIAIAPIENLVLEQDDRLELPVFYDVGDQRFELRSLDQGKEFGERMNGYLIATRAPFNALVGGRRFFGRLRTQLLFCERDLQLRARPRLDVRCGDARENR